MTHYFASRNEPSLHLGCLKRMKEPTAFGVEGLHMWQ